MSTAAPGSAPSASACGRQLKGKQGGVVPALGHSAVISRGNWSITDQGPSLPRSHLDATFLEGARGRGGEGARKGEGQRAENAFNNINIGGGDGDGDDGQRVSHRVPR